LLLSFHGRKRKLKKELIHLYSMLKVRYLIVHDLLFLLSCNKRKEAKEKNKAAMKQLKNNCIPLKSVNSQGKQFISY
ncbi:MAG: hypothetical protein K6F29_09290, partial [Bacteroidales bacterium]|nr:hypothetical protein [Bacteroidales bacterium]